MFEDPERPLKGFKKTYMRVLIKKNSNFKFHKDVIIKNLGLGTDPHLDQESVTGWIRIRVRIQQNTWIRIWIQ
jgi:hypothetical protein